MTGGPVWPTVAHGWGTSCPAPTAVSEQRRRSTCGFDRFHCRADIATEAGAARSLRAAGGGQLPSQGMSVEPRRLTPALLLSLLIHTLLLSLTFGGQALGLPGFDFPWRERRIETPDLRVVLVPAQIAGAAPAGKSVKEPLHQPAIEQLVAVGPALTASVSAAPALGRTAEAIVPKAESTAPAKAELDSAAVPAKAPLRTEGSGDTAPKAIPEPVVIAMERSEEATWIVPAAVSVPTPAIATAPSTAQAGLAAQEQIDSEARERAAALAKLDRSEREAQRKADLAAARVAAAQLEAARQEAARVEGARLAAAQLEAQRREAAQVEAARLEAERQEAARLAAAQLEAQRQGAARQQAARVEAARVEGERQEAMRQAAARQVAARVLAEQEEDARRDARRRAMGLQLDEEAARRDAASTAARSPSTLPLSLSTARRVRLWGLTDPNAELVQYAEAWARKIQFNTSVDTVREFAQRPHSNPMVMVAIRSDGSVESVSFVLSSGVAELDEAIRRIVQNNVPYQVFPPALAREFDVIEVRRTWHFDMAVRLY